MQEGSEFVAQSYQEGESFDYDDCFEVLEAELMRACENKDKVVKSLIESNKSMNVELEAAK